MTAIVHTVPATDEADDVQSTDPQAQSIEIADTAIAFICVKTDKAQKLGRNGGFITYKVLADIERQHVYLTVVENDRGGAWSRDIVDFAAEVEDLLGARVDVLTRDVMEADRLRRASIEKDLIRL